MFDQSTVNKIAADIKKIANWKKESYGNQSFEYMNHRFYLAQVDLVSNGYMQETGVANRSNLIKVW